jgi:hypothetical protein
MTIFQYGQAAPVIPGIAVAIVPPQTNFLSPAQTDILGIVGTATWGPVNMATPVAGAADYPSKFGQPQNRLYDMGLSVNFATLQGAQNDRCVRVTDGTDTAATGKLGLTGAPTLVAAGTGFAANDTVTFPNGAVIKVLTVTGGVISTFSVVTQPTATTAGTLAQTAASGSGTGASFSFAYAYGALATSKYTGSGANTDTVTIAAGNAVGTWKVTVFRQGVPAEVFNNLGAGLSGAPLWAAIVAAVNNGSSATRGPSNLVILTVGTSTAAPVAGTITLAGGTDGATTITSAILIGSDATGARTGMYALRKSGASVGMLADCSDSTTWTVQAAFALSEGLEMITCGPAGDTITNATTVKASAGVDTYGLKILFGDWIIANSPTTGAQILVNPAAFAAGWIAANRPQLSPLNKPLFGIVGTQKALTNTSYQADELALLQAAGIDVIMNPSPGGNYFSCAFGHNCSSNPAIRGDNYTRMTNFIAATISAGLGGFIGQLQTPGVQAQAKATLDAYFSNLWTASPPAIGSSDPTVTPWLVVLNSSNNPQSQVSLGKMLAQVKVIFLSVIEEFEVDVEGGQTVQITRTSTTSAQ